MFIIKIHITRTPVSDIEGTPVSAGLRSWSYSYQNQGDELVITEEIKEKLEVAFRGVKSEIENLTSRHPLLDQSEFRITVPVEVERM